jgi:hypothetical protein
VIPGGSKSSKTAASKSLNEAPGEEGESRSFGLFLDGTSINK